MLSWQVGDVTIRRVLELEVTFGYSESQPFIRDATPAALAPIDWLRPHFATPEGDLKLSIHALLVDAPGLRLVVDTCIGNDRPRGATGNRPLALPFLERFAESGWQPEDVNAVVCTHLHVDHVGWNTRLVAGRWVPTFPNARYLIGHAEHAHWQADPGEENQQILADSVQPIFDAGLAELVDMDHKLSSHVRLLPTPGHTPGHVSVVIESRGERAVITGDMIHHPCQLAHPEWSPEFDSDKDAARITRRGFFETVADSDTLIIGTHFPAPTAGRIERDGSGYRLVSASE
jgi:glyoxylase-like metal-dependent hydrolase (beta-lactamase superfamily II)